MSKFLTDYYDFQIKYHWDSLQFFFPDDLFIPTKNTINYNYAYKGKCGKMEYIQHKGILQKKVQDQRT